MINKKFYNKNNGRCYDGRFGRKSYGGQNYYQNTKDEARSSTQKQKGKNSNHSHDKIKEIREEEEQGKDLEDEVPIENVFTMKKKGIKHLSIPNAKERQIREQKGKLELCMFMKMPNYPILKMLKEENSQLQKILTEW